MNVSPFVNTALFTAPDLEAIFGIGAMHNIPPNLEAHGVSTDTRTLERGNIFVALVGERFDAHTLIPQAVERGASLIITNAAYYAQERQMLLSENIPVIAVENTLHALGELAHAHRLRFAIPVVAVAGAAGKTTTKEMIAAVLAKEYVVLKTEGNFNNQIGVPLTLLHLDARHTAAVVEIGTNEPGEIGILSNIVAPTHGLITNIGKEHLEKLINLDGVEHEETALFRFLEQTGGTAIINIDDERLRKQSAYLASQCTYSLAPRRERKADLSADVEFSSRGESILHLTYKIGKKQARADVQLSVVGLTMAHNALAAAAVGCTLGISLGNIASALRAFRPSANDSGYGRMLVQELHIDKNTLTLLNDCYNANPTSMYAALETLRLLPLNKPEQRKIAVLADMRELGNAAEDEHRQLLEFVRDAEWLDMALCTGEEMRNILTNHHQIWSDTRILYASTIAECAERLRATASNGDIVLLKGSRGMKLEEIIGLLTNGSSSPQ